MTATHSLSSAIYISTHIPPHPHLNTNVSITRLNFQYHHVLARMTKLLFCRPSGPSHDTSRLNPNHASRHLGTRRRCDTFHMRSRSELQAFGVQKKGGSLHRESLPFAFTSWVLSFVSFALRLFVFVPASHDRYDTASASDQRPVNPVYSIAYRISSYQPLPKQPLRCHLQIVHPPPLRPSCRLQLLTDPCGGLPGSSLTRKAR